MLRIEVNESVQALRFVLHPDRSEDSDVDGTHEALSKKVKAVTDMPSLDVFRILKSPFSL